MFDRVLISIKPFLGDAVMATPSVRAIAGADRKPFALTSRTASVLFKEVVDSTGCIEPGPGKGLPATLREARRLRQYRFQIAVIVNLSFRSALISRLAGIPRRIGHAWDGRTFLLTDRIKHRPNEFQATSIARLLGPLGIEVAEPCPRLDVGRDIKERSLELLEGATVGFHPGSRDPWKRLPSEKTLCIVEGLRDQGHKVAMFGGQEERAAGTTIKRCLNGGVVDLIGRTSIEELIGCFGHLSASFGGDTGVMHLSAAAGCPTVQVFGSDRSGRWGHNYSPHRVLRAPGDDLQRVSEGEILAAVLTAIG